jgi:hypothetical protein
MGNKTNIAHIFCAQSTSCSVVRGKALLFWLLILYADGVAVEMTFLPIV